jgi:hypothetical protein
MAAEARSQRAALEVMKAKVEPTCEPRSFARTIMPKAPSKVPTIRTG